MAPTLCWALMLLVSPPSNHPLLLPTSDLGEDLGFSHTTTRDLQIDARGYLWVLNPLGLWCYNGRRPTLILQSEPTITSFAVDGEGGLWAVRGGQLDYVSPGFEKREGVTLRRSLAEANALLLPAGQKQIWMVTQQAVHLIRAEPNQLTQISQYDGSASIEAGPRFGRTGVTAEGDLWLMGNDHLVRCSANGLQSSPIDAAVFPNRVNGFSAISAGADGVWLVNSSKLFFFNSATTAWSHMMDLPTADQPLKLVADKHERLWLLTPDQLLRIEPYRNHSQRVIVADFDQPSPRRRTILNLAATNPNGLWLGTESGPRFLHNLVMMLEPRYAEGTVKSPSPHSQPTADNENPMQPNPKGQALSTQNHSVGSPTQPLEQLRALAIITVDDTQQLVSSAAGFHLLDSDSGEVATFNRMPASLMPQLDFAVKPNGRLWLWRGAWRAQLSVNLLRQNQNALPQPVFVPVRGINDSPGNANGAGKRWLLTQRHARSQVDFPGADTENPIEWSYRFGNEGPQWRTAPNGAVELVPPKPGTYAIDLRYRYRGNRWTELKEVVQIDAPWRLWLSPWWLGLAATVGLAAIAGLFFLRRTPVPQNLPAIPDSEPAVPPARATAPPKADRETAGNKQRILVVDDDPINRQVLVSQLNSQYETAEAASGSAALDVLEREAFDLVLLDIMMPGLSGYGACRQIRETWSMEQLPIIFITARNLPEDIVRGFAEGGNDYMIKPVSRDELFSRVRMHLTLKETNRLLEKEKAWLEAEIELERLARLNRESSIRLLQSQMSPHFIQNTLNSISFLCLSNPEQAVETLERLSTLLRQSFNAIPREWWPLEEEIKAINAFCDIQAVRFGDKFRFKCQVADAVKSLMLPPFLIQPLVENAVFYGLKETWEAVEIGLEITQQGHLVRVTVTNPGKPLAKPFSELISAEHALGNISERLALMFDSEVEHHYEAGHHRIGFHLDLHRPKLEEPTKPPKETTP